VYYLSVVSFQTSSIRINRIKMKKLILKLGVPERAERDPWTWTGLCRRRKASIFEPFGREHWCNHNV